MGQNVEYEFLEDLLQRCGASWDAAQTHGLVTGRIATSGQLPGADFLPLIMDSSDERNAAGSECRKLLESLHRSTYGQLSERMSEFEPLLPADDVAIELRVAALAHWCEGFLHGLVSAPHVDVLKKRLAALPLSDVIKDLLQITRAGPDHEGDNDENDAAYADLVEYLRVAAQLSYEELADLHDGNSERSVE